MSISTTQRSLVAFTVLASAGSACAGASTSFGFEGVSNNNATNTATGEAQFELRVDDAGGDAMFTFLNHGPLASVMSELYWDDNASVLDSMIAIDDSHPNVDYESLGSGVNPGNMPAGNTISFSADFATEPNNPQPHNGVGVTQWLAVTFDINGPYADLIAALESGELRVGVHAQAFANGGSESFVTDGTPPTGVPTPSAALLGLAMLLGTGLRRRR